MTLRSRIFIATSIAVLVILGISILLVVSSKNKNAQPKVNTPGNTSTAQNNGNQSSSQVLASGQTPTGLPAKVATTLEMQKNGVEQLAKTFVERFGSYSTDNNSQNIKDVSTLVTQSYWSKISTLIASNTATSTKNFTGVTTKVISISLANWSDTKATVILKVMRTEDKNGVLSTRYQNAAVQLVKSNDAWLVDSLTWN